MAVHAVLYTYAADSDAARDTHRPAHRAFLSGLHDAGQLLASGPFGPEGAPGALILVDAESPAAAAALLDDDPFRLEGLVADRTVRAWTIAVGALTAA